VQPLREVQHVIARAVVAGDVGAAAAAIVADAPGAAERLQIYRNHYLITLTDALAATFPVVQRLVGEAFFRATARHFAGVCPPTSPCLFEYGGDFPAYLAALPQAASLAYLADVALLEWALNEAQHAPDAVRLDVPALAARPPAGLKALVLPLHPSCRLVVSRYPIDRIWRANRSCAVAETIELAAGGVRLLVHRDGGEVGWRRLSPAPFTFVAELLRGRPLAAAAGEALGAEPGFDILAFAAELAESGLLLPPISEPAHTGGAL
jgi:hypothetical protein